MEYIILLLLSIIVAYFTYAMGLDTGKKQAEEAMNEKMNALQSELESKLQEQDTEFKEKEETWNTQEQAWKEKEEQWQAKEADMETTATHAIAAWRSIRDEVGKEDDYAEHIQRAIKKQYYKA